MTVWLNLFTSLSFSIEGGRIFFHLVDIVNILLAKSMTKLSSASNIGI